MHAHLLLLLCPGPPLEPVAFSALDPPLLIRAERVIVRPGEVLEDAAVLIDRGMIVAVGPGVSAPEGAREIEGRVVCAGFVNPWTALGTDGASADELNTSPATMTVDGIDPWSDDHLRGEALRGGVTAARVQAGMRGAIGGIGAVVRSDPAPLLESVGRASGALLLEDACVAASVGVTRDGDVDGVFDRIEEVDKLVAKLEKARGYREDLVEYRHELEAWEKEIAELREELEEDFKKAKKAREKDQKEAEEKGKEFKEKKYKEPKKPRRPKFNPDEEALAKAAEGELPLVVEVHRASEIRRLLERTEGLDRLRLVIAGGTEAAVLAGELEQRRIPVIVWPAPMGQERPDEYEEHRLALAAELAEAGVEVLIGTGGTRPSRDLRLLAAIAVGHGMEPDQALAAITERPAGVFDLRDRIGTVERGREADVLVLDGDPLDSAASVLYVVSGGRVVVEP